MTLSKRFVRFGVWPDFLQFDGKLCREKKDALYPLAKSPKSCDCETILYFLLRNSLSVYVIWHLFHTV